MSQSKFTETDTEAFYDAEDSLYRSFWDSEGSLHWGYFLDLTATPLEEFIPACQRWNGYEKTGCEVVGIDLSNVRISNALAKAQDYPSLRLQFQKASATNLPFKDGTFTHVWSQATLYHIHQRELAGTGNLSGSSIRRYLSI